MPQTAAIINMKLLLEFVWFFAFCECVKFHHQQPVKNSHCEVAAPVFVLNGELKLTLLVRECNSSEIVHTKTLVNSAIWTVERLNFLEFTTPLRLGLTVFKVCDESDYFNALFKTFVDSKATLQLGVISDRNLITNKLREFGGVLEMEYAVTKKYWSCLVKASVRLLDALELQENVTVVASREDVLMEFFRQSRKQWVCVRHCILME